MKKILLSLVLVVAANQGFASDDTAQSLLQQAKDLYGKREVLANTQQALQLLLTAETEAQNADLKYDVLIWQSRVLYWLAMKETQKDPRLEKFVSSYEAAEKARLINDTYAEGYYYYGISLARWGETKGPLNAVFRKNELIDKLKGALDRDTRDGKMGEEIDGYGPDRILGRVYTKLPGSLGGDLNLSVKHLLAAYTKAPTYIINGQYLAETYLEFSPPQTAYACQILNDLVSKNPADLNADRLPETMEEYQEAMKLKQEKCK